MTPEQVLARLAGTFDLTRAETAALADAVTVSSVEANRTISRRGGAPEALHLLLSGWAGREKLVESGARQFCLFFLPGDVCDLDAFALDRLTHSTSALTACEVAVIDRRSLADTVGRSPRAVARLLRLLSLENSALTEWTINLGRRTALERTANLLSELAMRLARLGLASEGRFELPVSQEMLADRLGLTAVHLNRMLQRLRTDGVIHLAQRRITIADPARLARLGGFDPAYLHFA